MSAILLGGFALFMAVNVISALLLRDQDHRHAAHFLDHAHADLNLRAAYLHVIADAATFHAGDCRPHH